MILVVGATGPLNLGGEICRQLRAAGLPVRALVRPTSDPRRVAELKVAGVETVTGDLKDRASLATICRGVGTVIATATTATSRQEGDTIERVDLQGHLDLLEAAQAAKVQHYINMSFSSHLSHISPLQAAKRAVEQRLRQSGLAYSILRPSFFMEAWLGPAVGFDYPNAAATLYGSGHAKISWIALPDVARLTCLCVGNPSTKNVELELGGPEALSPLEAVLIFEDVTGKRFNVQHVPDEALQAQYAGASDPLQQSFAALMLDYASGDQIPMDATLRLFPTVQLTSVRAYAQRVGVPAPAAMA